MSNCKNEDDYFDEDAARLLNKLALNSVWLVSPLEQPATLFRLLLRARYFCLAQHISQHIWAIRHDAIYPPI
jgi:hypothetical protein